MYLRALVLIALVGCPSPMEEPEPTPPLEDRAFSMVVLPDIQYLTLGNAHILEDMIDFILDDQRLRSIRFVVQEGDITHNNTDDEWVVATTQFGRLHGVVPYAVCVGNHDMRDSDVDRDTGLFNTHFGPSGYSEQPTFAGRRQDDVIDDHFHTFRVADVDWLVLSLSWNPRPDALAWADEVLADHPTHRVIALTHAHLGPDGTRTTIGERIWEGALRGHPNVSFVLNGHYTGGEAARSVGEGDDGNAVQEIFSNYQTRPLGGSGILRLMAFDPDARTVEVETFSPFTDLVLDDDENAFILTDIDLFPL
jgi:hypothetical protein